MRQREASLDDAILFSCGNHDLPRGLPGDSADAASDAQERLLLWLSATSFVLDLLQSSSNPALEVLRVCRVRGDYGFVVPNAGLLEGVD